METYSSKMVDLPCPGDFAAGVRTKNDTLTVRGDFATGMTGLSRPLSPHHGDFAHGLRVSMQHPMAGDFAAGLRVAGSPAPA
jgi:hypothetical protein